MEIVGPGRVYGKCLVGYVEVMANDWFRVGVQDAIVKGWLMTERSPVTGRTDWKTVMHVAQDIAAGMAELHRHNVIHGVCLNLLRTPFLSTRQSPLCALCETA